MQSHALSWARGVFGHPVFFEVFHNLEIISLFDPTFQVPSYIFKVLVYQLWYTFQAFILQGTTHVLCLMGCQNKLRAQ